MPFRSTLIAAASAGALLAPGAAQAASPVAVDVPCIDAIVSTYTCAAPTPAPTATEPCPGSDLVPTAANAAAIRTSVLCLLNEERAKHHLRPLDIDGSLQTVAGSYAKRMVRERFFDHTSPDGGTFLSRIKRTSYLRGSFKRWSVGENIAWGSGTLATPESILKAWMRSPGHRRNILTPGFDELGLGIAGGAPRSLGSGLPAATYVSEFGVRRR